MKITVVIAEVTGSKDGDRLAKVLHAVRDAGFSAMLMSHWEFHETASQFQLLIDTSLEGLYDDYGRCLPIIQKEFPEARDRRACNRATGAYDVPVPPPGAKIWRIDTRHNEVRFAYGNETEAMLYANNHPGDPPDSSVARWPGP